KTLLLKVIPAGRAEEPRKPAVPAGPVIEETSGKFSTERTYQNLLQNEHDELLFDYYFTSQLCLFNLETRQIRFLGKPAIYDKVIFSPDNKYLLVEIINRPYSYAVPHYRFPRSFEIWDSNGNKLKTIYQRPLQDEIPIGGTYQGPRYFQWQPIQDAILVWVEALDEGDPKKKVEHRDRVMRLSAPFSDQPEELFRITHRYSSLYWSQQKDELIYSEYDRDLLWTRHWLYRIGADKPSLLFDLSINNRYDHPGGIISRFTARGEEVFIKEGDWVFYNNVMGATPQGNYPHLSRINLRNGRKETLFTSRENFYEKAICFTDTLLTEITFQSENNNSPRNYFLKNLSTGRTIRITDFPHPYPEISGIPINIEKYTRKDGVPLSGTLYLPPDYKPGQRLPLIFHAYPEEYTDVTTAGQVKSSPFQFTRFRGASVKFLVLAGYAVLANASIPIIGEPETVNENFIEQLLASVQAAVDHLDSEGIIDPERVGIMGHSYGAFMVANVLAHSDICKTGVALSGAYNRTLTPYGFQSERRTLWQARDFYIKVSPFLFADNIKNPLLLIHGQDDPNAGTFPMQSQRMFQALKGQGATARLVLLPLEGHGYRARESNLHVLAEIINWFDKYLKNVTSK
ncbi:MAG: S9 family peptidase, partial [Candidatus Cloacimonetes bacterium]|nr:S9 family peptidase [Candidatus Cloacimonadota bacterium]